MEFGSEGGFGFGGAGGGSGTIAGANNGASTSSIDPTKIVLGQDVGQAGNPARLISNREIPLNTFGLNFLGSSLDTGILADGSFLQGGPTSLDGLNFWSGEPNNFLTIYPGHGEAGRFTAGWQRFNGVNTYPRPNIVGQFWAYNYNVGGSTEIAGEAGFGFRTETDFDLNGGGSDYFELHLPEVAVPSGLTCRLWSWYISKVSLATIHQSQCQNFNFNTKNENETWWAWTATTSGGNPDTDRQIDLEYSAKGNSALVIQNFSDQGAIWAPGFFNWDRGSINIGLNASGASINNRLISFTGNVRQTGAGGSGASFISTFSLADQLTFIGLQMISATFNNNPTFLFDRRNGSGSSILPDGTNAGEISWNAGGRDMQILGRANGNHGVGGGCYDAVINGIDTDNVTYDQLVVGRDGNSVFRGSITTGNPGISAAAWKLGAVQAAVVVLDATRYVEVNIAGTGIVKLAIVN